jgi:hypothetical protein
MKSKIILLVITTLMLSACGDDGNGGSPVTGNGSGGGGGLIDVTDKAGCQGPARPGNSIYQTGWKQMLSGEGVSIEMTLYISNSSQGTISNTCFYPDGRSLTARLPIAISVGNGTVHFLHADEKTERLSIGGNNYSCSVGVNSGVAQYALVGDCLQMTMNGQSDFLVR